MFFLISLAMLSTDAHIRETEEWRRQYEARLRADDGWLTVAGLYWLKEGANTFGADPRSDIVLPQDAAPDRAGTFEFHSGKVTFRAAPNSGVRHKGKPVTILEMRSDTPGPADEITMNGLTLFVIRREDRYAIRLRDKNSTMRRSFSGLKWYPVQTEFRVEGRWTPYDPPKTLSIPNIVGIAEKMKCPGRAAFTLDGQELTLEPVMSGNRLFFIFRDKTAGKTTYGAGRFLYADLPKNGKVTLDFNRAYSPPCAWTPYATCPLPPKQNYLDAAVEAGELSQGH